MSQKFLAHLKPIKGGILHTSRLDMICQCLRIYLMPLANLEYWKVCAKLEDWIFFYPSTVYYTQQP